MLWTLDKDQIFSVVEFTAHMRRLLLDGGMSQSSTLFSSLLIIALHAVHFANVHFVKWCATN